MIPLTTFRSNLYGERNSIIICIDFFINNPKLKKTYKIISFLQVHFGTLPIQNFCLPKDNTILSIQTHFYLVQDSFPSKVYRQIYLYIDKSRAAENS